MSNFKVLQEIDKEHFRKPLTARELMQNLKELTPDGYDMQVVCVKGDPLPNGMLRYTFELQGPSIVMMLDGSGENVMSTNLFVK